MNKFIHDNSASHELSKVVCLENARVRSNNESQREALIHVQEFYQKCNDRLVYARKVLRPITRIIDCINYKLELIKKGPLSLFYAPLKCFVEKHDFRELVKNHEWHNLLSHYDFIKTVKVNLSRTQKHDSLKKSLDNVFSRKSVLIAPKNNHFILVYCASNCCNDVIVHYHDPEAEKNEEYGDMEADDLESQIINSGNPSFLEIIIKK